MKKAEDATSVSASRSNEKSNKLHRDAYDRWATAPSPSLNECMGYLQWADRSHLRSQATSQTSSFFYTCVEICDDALHMATASNLLNKVFKDIN